MVMGLPLRQAAGVLYATLLVGIYFVPGIPDNFRQPTAMTVLLLYVLINRRSKPAWAANPPRRIWVERDMGEKFSIVMFHVLVGTFIAFLVWQQLQMAMGPNGEWWQFVLAGLVTAASIWAVWRNWSSRNAR
jgi:hypothetical protein